MYINNTSYNTDNEIKTSQAIRNIISNCIRNDVMREDIANIIENTLKVSNVNYNNSIKEFSAVINRNDSADYYYNNIANAFKTFFNKYPDAKKEVYKITNNREPSFYGVSEVYCIGNNTINIKI